jgi:hypothetical protein
MKNILEENNKLLKEETRLLEYMKERMQAGDDEESLLKIAARIDTIKARSNRLLGELVYIGDQSEEREISEEEELNALRKKFENNRDACIKRYKLAKALTGFLSLVVVIVGGSVGLIYAGPIGAIFLWFLGLILYYGLTSKFWVCPVCSAPFRKCGMSAFSSKLSSRASCERCGFSVREIS